jgi:hypothetical protein
MSFWHKLRWWALLGFVVVIAVSVWRRPIERGSRNFQAPPAPHWDPHLNP